MSKLLSIDLLPLSSKAGVRVKGNNTSERAASEMPAYPEHLKQILGPHSLPDGKALGGDMAPVSQYPNQHLLDNNMPTLKDCCNTMLNNECKVFSTVSTHKDSDATSIF